MTDAYVVWQLAQVEQQVDEYSSFLDACPWSDPAARLTCRKLADSVRMALALGQADEARVYLSQLVDHTWEWRDRPGYPDARHPGEADRQVRDRVKDFLRSGGFPWLYRKRVSDLKLSIDVAYNRLAYQPGLDQDVRNAVGYVYGRATMALDLGHFDAAQRELERLAEMSAEFGTRE